jgi:methyl-accepting chemotaxis protein
MELIDLAVYSENNDPTLIGTVKAFSSRPDLQDTKGLQRLAIVCENYKKFTLEQAYHLINPDAFRDEFEDTQTYKFSISFLSYCRVVLGIAPLILTWFALFTAANSYQQDLRNYPGDRTEAFLKLWQDGFHSTTFLTFSTTALTDVILLVLFVGVTILALFLEYQARSKSKKFAEELHDVTDGLLKAVSKEGSKLISSQADIEKIAEGVRLALGDIVGDVFREVQEVVEEVFKGTQKVVQDAAGAIEKSNQRDEELYTTRIEPMFNKFDQNVSRFQTSVAKLTDEVSRVAIASTEIAKAGTSMATSAEKMATSSSDLNMNIKQIEIISSHSILLSKNL